MATSDLLNIAKVPDDSHNAAIPTPLLIGHHPSAHLLNSIYDDGKHQPRYKRGNERGYIRLGRNDATSPSDGGNRYTDKHLIRFGRNESPAKPNNFIRFGRSDKAFVRLGRDDQDDTMRFGRRGDKFIRFGRSGAGDLKTDQLAKLRAFGEPIVNSENNLDEMLQTKLFDIVHPSSKRLSRNDKFIRFGRRDNGFIRLGKKNKEYSTFDDEPKQTDIGTLNEYVGNGGGDSAASSDIGSTLPMFRDKPFNNIDTIDLNENHDKLLDNEDYL